MKKEQRERAYRLAVEELANACGTCPYDVYGFNCDCDKRCNAGSKILPDCWAIYFDAKGLESE